MALFLVFFGVSSPTVAVYSPKSGYPSAETPYLEFELLFLVVSATRVEIQSQKWFVQHSMEYSMDETIVALASNFVPQKDRGR